MLILTYTALNDLDPDCLAAHFLCGFFLILGKLKDLY